MDKDGMVAVWRLYKEKFSDTLPDNTFERVVYCNMRIMFEPQISDRQWITMRNSKVNKWFLYHSCGVHELSAGGVIVYLLVEKDYSGLNANKEILTQMVQPGFLKLTSCCKCMKRYLIQA